MQMERKFLASHGLESMCTRILSMGMIEQGRASERLDVSFLAIGGRHFLRWNYLRRTCESLFFNVDTESSAS